MLATSSFVELKVARAEGVESRPCARAVIRFCQATEADGGTVVFHLFSSPGLLLVDQEGCRRLWVSLGRP